MKKTSPWDIMLDDQAIMVGIDVSARLATAVHADDELAFTSNFFGSISRHCEIECCGLDALDFSSHSIRNSTCYNADNQHALAALRTRIAGRGDEVLSFKTLNCFIHRDTFVALLDHVLLEFRDAV